MFSRFVFHINWWSAFYSFWSSGSGSGPLLCGISCCAGWGLEFLSRNMFLFPVVSWAWENSACLWHGRIRIRKWCSSTSPCCNWACLQMLFTPSLCSQWGGGRQGWRGGCCLEVGEMWTRRSFAFDCWYRWYLDPLCRWEYSVQVFWTPPFPGPYFYATVVVVGCCCPQASTVFPPLNKIILWTYEKNSLLPCKEPSLILKDSV